MYLIILSSFFNTKMFMPSIFFTVAAGLGAAFLLVKRADQRISLKTFIIYALVTILVYCLCGLSGFLSFDDPLLLFIISQAVFLVLGIIHFVFLTRLIKVDSEKDNFFQELVFTLFVGILGVFAYQVVFSFTSNVEYSLLFSAAQIMFLVPFLLLKLSQRAVVVPHKVFAKWYYPSDPQEMAVSDDVWNSDSAMIVQFLLTRSPENDEVSILRGTCPANMEFGLFFANLIADWNESNPKGQIRMLDDADVPFGWNFYVEKSGFFGSRDYIDPAYSIRENGISEQDRIIGERV